MYVYSSTYNVIGIHICMYIYIDIHTYLEDAIHAF